MSQRNKQTVGQTHVAQYLTKQRQPENDSWLVNRIKQEKCFSSKIMQKFEAGRLVPDPLFDF